MTKKTITSYILSLGVAIVVLAGVITVQASEVTGTLSSDASNGPQTTGNIQGTVSGDPQTTGNLSGTVSGDPQTTGNLGGTVVSVSSGSGGGGGSSSGGGGGSSSNLTPSGSVLGASTLRSPTPGFPNAGTAPEVSSFDQLSWSTMMSFLKNALSL